MKEHFKTLKKSLFAGLNNAQIEHLLRCLNAQLVHADKHQVLIEQEEYVKNVFVVLEGVAYSQKLDTNGKLFLVSKIEQGGVIGVLLSASYNKQSSVFVTAQTKLLALKLNFDCVCKMCPQACEHHTRFLQNYMNEIASKALELHERNNCLIKSSVRDKVLTFLRQHEQQKDSVFCVDFSRQQMADYLNVERTALSRELSKMKQDGLLDFHKNYFRLF